MLKHFLAALLLLIGTADAQTFGSSSVETTAAFLTASSNVFTPPCPTLSGPQSGVYNIVVTAASQSIALPASCPGSSVGLFVTFNICNGKSGTAPCNGTATGPFSPGIAFGTGFEFPSPTGFTETQLSGAKDIVTCEVMGTTGPWSCGSPQYALVGAPTSGVLSHCGSTVINSTSNTCVLNLTSGSTLIVGMGRTGGSVFSSITGTGVGTCTQFTNAENTNIDLLYCPVTSSGTSVTITLTLATTDHFWFGALDVSGLTGTPDDTGVGAAGGGNSSALTITGAGPTTEANELVVAVAYILSNSTFTAGSGYTISDQATDSSAQSGAIEYQFQAATGTPTAPITASVGAGYAMALGAAKH